MPFKTGKHRPAKDSEWNLVLGIGWQELTIPVTSSKGQFAREIVICQIPPCIRVCISCNKLPKNHPVSSGGQLKCGLQPPFFELPSPRPNRDRFPRPTTHLDRLWLLPLLLAVASLTILKNAFFHSASLSISDSRVGHFLKRKKEKVSVLPLSLERETEAASCRVRRSTRSSSTQQLAELRVQSTEIRTYVGRIKESLLKY